MSTLTRTVEVEAIGELVALSHEDHTTFRFEESDQTHPTIMMLHLRFGPFDTAHKTIPQAKIKVIIEYPVENISIT